MGIIGENLTEGTRKHHNPQWDNGGKPANPNADAIRRKHEERASGTVDWASRFAEDARFGGAKDRFLAEQRGHSMMPAEPPDAASHEEVMADFAALAERARAIAARVPAGRTHLHLSFLRCGIGDDDAQAITELLPEMQRASLHF